MGNFPWTLFLAELRKEASLSSVPSSQVSQRHWWCAAVVARPRGNGRWMETGRGRAAMAALQGIHHLRPSQPKPSHATRYTCRNPPCRRRQWPSRQMLQPRALEHGATYGRQDPKAAHTTRSCWSDSQSKCWGLTGAWRRASCVGGDLPRAKHWCSFGEPCNPCSGSIVGVPFAWKPTPRRPSVAHCLRCGYLVAFPAVGYLRSLAAPFVPC